MTTPPTTSRAATPSAPPSSVHGPTIWAASLAALVAQMCLTILAPLNGLIQSQFGASASQLTWLSAAVFAPTALLELSFGVLGDLFGRKRLMVIGTGSVVAGGVVGAWFASGVPSMAVALVLLGLGAALLLPSTLATVAEFSPTPEARAHALSRWALAISLGAALSPLVSGIAAQVGGLGAAFLPLLVVAAVALVVVVLVARESRSPEGRALDWPGQALLIVGLLCFIFAIIQGADRGFGQPAVVGALIVSIGALVAFVLVELRSPAPMFQIRLLRRPAFAAASAAGLLGMLGFMGTAYAVAMKLGPIAQAAPLTIALPFVLIQLIPLLLAGVLPRLVARVSPRRLLSSGLVVLAAGQVWLAALADGETRLLPMAPPILLMGVGFIVMFTSLTAAAVNSVPHRYIGMASGATSLVRETGQTLGSGIVAAIAMSTAGSVLSNDLKTAPLPAGAMDTVRDVAAQGGPLALAHAPLPEPIRSVVAPLALHALERGFDVGLLAMAGCSLLAALIVVLVMRGGAGADEETGEGVMFAEGEEYAGLTEG